MQLVKLRLLRFIFNKLYIKIFFFIFNFSEYKETKFLESSLTNIILIYSISDIY